MNNMPEVKLGIIASSRSCFPSSLSERRREAIVKEFGDGIYNCKTLVINENDALKAIEEVKANGVNALDLEAGA